MSNQKVLEVIILVACLAGLVIVIIDQTSQYLNNKTSTTVSFVRVTEQRMPVLLFCAREVPKDPKLPMFTAYVNQSVYDETAFDMSAISIQFLGQAQFEHEKSEAANDSDTFEFTDIYTLYHGKCRAAIYKEMVAVKNYLAVSINSSRPYTLFLVRCYQVVTVHLIRTVCLAYSSMIRPTWSSTLSAHSPLRSSGWSLDPPSQSSSNGASTSSPIARRGLAIPRSRLRISSPVS